MKKNLTLIAALFVASAVSIFAQSTGSSPIGALQQSLERRGAYGVERLGADQLSVRSLRSGARVCSVTMPVPHMMTLSATITHLNNPGQVVLDEALRMIARFNFSAAVGTMELDGNGGVMMEHYLNPQLLSPETIADVVTLFGATVESEESRFANRLGKL